MKIEEIKNGVCIGCGEAAQLSLDGQAFCNKCADNRLIKQIYRCAKAVKYAKITLNVLPKENA